MTEKWRLNRVHQCKLCPWKVGTDPTQIPDGYSLEKHIALGHSVIAEPGVINDPSGAMLCHKSPANGKKKQMCVGWIHNQRGPGNNLPLRMRLASCENANEIKVFGAQHQCFEDTYLKVGNP